MLLHHLFSRDKTPADDDGAFRVRGEAVSRLEGFSDTVFGFAITLLVISLKPPDTAVELLDMRHSVLPFIASFFVLFVVWRLQFDFFRRYGLEDRTTVNLTGVLLMFVLLAVYPLRVFFTFTLDVLPRALIAGNDSMKASVPMELLPKVLMLYALGVVGVTAILALLYRHAATRGETLGLSELELFDTRVLIRRYTGAAITHATVALWCLAMLSLGTEHVRARDSVWQMGYTVGWLTVFVMALTQAVALRRMKRARPSVSPAASPL